jgi:hypothetical protein
MRLVPARAMPKMKIGVYAMALNRHRRDDDVVALPPLVEACLKRRNEIGALVHNRRIAKPERMPKYQAATGLKPLSTRAVARELSVNVLTWLVGRDAAPPYPVSAFAQRCPDN